MIQELVCNNDEGEIPNSNVGNEILKELRQETKLYFENIEGIDKPFSAWEVSDLFMLAFSKTMTFVKYVIDSAPPNDETFIPQITRGFNREKYLTFCISKGLLDCLRRYLRKESRQFLISLDGFDSAFDSFRGGSGKTNSLEFLSLRSAFEIDWLRSFLRFVLQVRDRSNDFFCARLDFCVTVPKDRFLEVLQLERDSYRAWRRWRTIQWSGLELALLLRKRLEVLGEFQVTRKEQVSSSLNEALRHVHFRHLPQQIEFKHNEKEYVIPLFMYVLRHTFWRPREILLHFGSILALGEELLRSSIDVDADSIRQCIKAANPQIIESEFFSELQSVLLNIRVIVRSFSRQSNVMKGTIVCELLSKVPFTFAANPGGVVTLLDKVEFLFSVGFLGVRADTGMRTRLGLGHEDAFFFNTGMSVFGGADIRDVQEWTYVIHPIFSEYLRLDTADSELTLRFDWTYLKFQEVQMRANGLAELSDISRGIDNLE
jgi:hypothetical protein